MREGTEMKKIKQSAVMAVCICMLMTGCGQTPGKMVNPGYDWQKKGDQAQQPDSGGTSGTEGTEAGQVSGKLSADPMDFQVEIDGQVYQFPMWYSDFTALGWEYMGDDQETVRAKGQSFSVEFQKDGKEFSFYIYNCGINAMPINECMVAGILIFDCQEDTQVRIAGGIGVGISTEEDVRKAYGDPDDYMELSSYTSLTYMVEEDYNSMVNISVDNETGLADIIEMKHMVEIEGILEEAMTVKGSVPELAGMYSEPTALGETPEEFIIKYDDMYLRLPVPVQVLLDHGWSLEVEEGDYIVEGNGYGYISLSKGEKYLYGAVSNTSGDAVYIQNAMITSLSSDYRYDGVEIEVAGGIRLGMDEEEFKEKIKKLEYTIDEYTGAYSVRIEENYYRSYNFRFENGVLYYIEISNQPE